MDTMIVDQTYQVSIYCGRRDHRGLCFVISLAKDICKQYLDGVNLGAVFTEVELIRDGNMVPGFRVDLFHDPLTPMTRDDIKGHVLHLAKRFKETYGQKRVTIIGTDETLTLGDH